MSYNLDKYTVGDHIVTLTSDRYITKKFSKKEDMEPADLLLNLYSALPDVDYAEDEVARVYSEVFEKKDVGTLKAWNNLLIRVRLQIEFIKSFFNNVQSAPKCKKESANYIYKVLKQEHPDNYVDRLHNPVAAEIITLQHGDSVLNNPSSTNLFQVSCSSYGCDVEKAQGYDLVSVFKMFYSNHYRELMSNQIRHIPESLQYVEKKRELMSWLPISEKLILVPDSFSSKHPFMHRKERFHKLCEMFKELVLATIILLKANTVDYIKRTLDDKRLVLDVNALHNKDGYEENNLLKIKAFIKHLELLWTKVNNMSQYNIYVERDIVKVCILTYGIGNGKSSTLHEYGQYDNEMSSAFRLRLKDFIYEFLPKDFYPIFIQIGLLYKAIEGVFDINAEKLIVNRSWIDHDFFAKKECRINMFDEDYYYSLFAYMNGLRNSYTKTLLYEMVLYSDDSFTTYFCKRKSRYHTVINYDSLAIRNIKWPFRVRHRVSDEMINQDRELENESFKSRKQFIDFMENFRHHVIKSLENPMTYSAYDPDMEDSVDFNDDFCYCYTNKKIGTCCNVHVPSEFQINQYNFPMAEQIKAKLDKFKEYKLDNKSAFWDAWMFYLEHRPIQPNNCVLSGSDYISDNITECKETKCEETKF